MADVLILGGTRNLGHVTATQLIGGGHSVAVLNRGITSDDLPSNVERIRATRGDLDSLRSSIGDRGFDMIVDLTTYTASDAREAVEVFSGRSKRYVFISSGQVYLVREGAERPFRETEYDGPIIDAPDPNSKDFGEWKYGADKRDAESVFDDAAGRGAFPVTTLRLPMVASERDHYGRIQGYFARLSDGEPILIPDEPGLPLRHVYVRDVARLIAKLVGSSAGIGKAFNISFGQSMLIEEYLEMLASISGRQLRLIRRPRAELDEAGLLPQCSPFSGKWMSELDNSRSLESFGDAVIYSDPHDYLPAVFDDYVNRWVARGMAPSGYGQRAREMAAISGRNSLSNI